MAYENMDYETILDRMLGRVLQSYPTLDTREGSIIYNALAPAALELAIMYTELDNVLNESFAETASRDYLLMKCREVGIEDSSFDATFGIHKGEFDVEVPIGSRWNCDLYNYEVISYIGVNENIYTYQLKCETSGVEPNLIVGDLTPIDDTPTGMYYAMLVECLIEGEDEASDDKIRKSYSDKVKNTNNDGNLAQYKSWCESYPGIGNYKVIPLWNGANTIKVSILDSSNDVASETLVSEFQNYLDPGVKGMGDGVAPIGAFVTVTTASELPINITANVTLKENYTDTSIIDQGLVEYFKKIAYDREILAYMQIGSAILDIEGVDFITNLKINGGTSDINLGVEQIPILGTTTWSVV